MAGLRVFLLIGVVAVAVLTGLAIMLVVGPLEADLAARVEQAMVDAGQSWAEIRIDGQMAVLSGVAPTVAAQQAAAEAAARVRGILKVRDASDLLPLNTNYVVLISRDGRGVTLGGSMPSVDMRNAVKGLVAAAMPGLPLRDETSLARGQPVDFLGLMRFAIARAAELAEGKVTLTGPDLSIEGTAHDEASFAAAAAALTKGLPANIDLRAVEILPPRPGRFAWRIALTGTQATITGYAPSAGFRTDIAAALAKAMPGVVVVDQTKLGSGAPAGLAAAAAFAVAELPHLDGGAAVIADGRLSLSGKAKSVDDHQALLADLALRRDRGDDGIPIGALDIVPPFVDPYVWHASRDGRRVVLAGYVPTEEIRATISEMAAKTFPGLAIDNRLAIAAGDPKMDWIAALQFSLTQLALLSSGSVSLEGRRYAIEGEAASIDAFKTLGETLGHTLPASMELAGNGVRPATASPFTLSIARTANGLTLGGFLPDEQASAALVAIARPRFPGAEIELGIEQASGMPDGFLDLAAAAIQAVSRLSGGRAVLAGSALALSGSAVSDDAKKAIEADLSAAVPAGGTLSSSVIVAVGGDPLSAAECQGAFEDALKLAAIAFTDDGGVKPESFGLIDRLAAIAQRCPAARLEIGGHTDSAGSARRNQAESEAEAQSVLERLVADGVRRERLTAVGYGETKPIASNATATGRDQNNRIAVTVRTD